MFLAVTRIPAIPDALQRAAAATGLVRVDVQRRLAGILPRVVLVDASRETIAAAQQALDAAGFGTIAFDPALAPSDDERLFARTLELEAGALVVISGVGAERRERVAAGDITLLQRALRTTTSSRQVTTRERKLSVGSALLTGGLKMTKTVERTASERSEAQERWLVVHRRDGGPDVVLAEPRLDYRFLGGALQAASHANFEATVTRVRALAPVPLDDRAARPGFASGLPACAADPLDVALFLLQLANVSAG